MIDQNKDENLEELVRQLEEQVNQVSDDPSQAPKRQDLQRQIDELRKQIEDLINKEIKFQKEKEPSYFSNDSEFPEDLYEKVEAVDIYFTKRYPIIIQTERADWIHLKKYPITDYRIDLYKNLREKAKAIAKERRFDAIFVDEENITIKTEFCDYKHNIWIGSLGKDQPTNINYSVSAIGILCKLKNNQEKCQNQLKI